MKLTSKNKAYIDSLNYRMLLENWRFAPVGDKWFEGETGEYWGKRMANYPIDEDEKSRISKTIGWGK